MIVLEFIASLTPVETTLYAFMGFNVFLASTCLLYKRARKTKARQLA